jgi:hypothetical protein
MFRAMRALVANWVVGVFLAGCCGGAVPPAEHAPEAPVAAPSAEVSPPPVAPAVEEPPPAAAPEPPAAAPEPQFTEGMSVAEAIKAVPQGAERANIDNETLGQPLQDFAVYEPCKPGAAKVSLKIAVWGGKAVGVDVTATPKNERLESCIKERIKGLTWQAKVKSLNTVEYAF